LRALVTGSSGFVGSHVVDALAAAGHEPRLFDLIPSPHHPVDEFDTRLGDVTDAEAVATAATGCDAVLHLAAVADVSHVVADPVYAGAVNAQGTLNVLEAARRAGVERVVYASTIWVYDGSPEPVVDEDARLESPRHPYTATKLAGEMFCRSYGEMFDVSTTITRFGIPYGPRARSAAVIPSFVKAALAGRPLTIAGTGEQSRRFTYVEDLAAGVVMALAPCAHQRVYNLASEETVTILQIAQAVRDLVGDTDILHTEARAADFRGAEISSARAAAELGWRASTPLALGLAGYVGWLRSGSGDPDPDPVG
jgi:UDP-glucose 4-epimerase